MGPDMSADDYEVLAGTLAFLFGPPLLIIACMWLDRLLWRRHVREFREKWRADCDR
jgi:hypothetical protein